MKLKADLHIHSTLSPCGSLEMSPSTIVQKAQELKLDLIAVTDHNTIENSIYTAKAAKNTNLSVIFGMEAQTAEDVHILCLFEKIKQAEAFYSEIYDCLPPLKNDPDVFGDQVVVDENDEVIRFEERLLLNSLSLSISEITEITKLRGGIVIPSHIESETFGLMMNLGFIPTELEDAFFEISYNVTPHQVLETHPLLSGFPLISNSDAHYPADMGRAYTVYDLNAPTLAEINHAARNGNTQVVRRGATPGNGNVTGTLNKT